MFLFIHMMILLNSWHASRENYIFWTFLINCPCHVSHKHKWADSWTYPLSPYLWKVSSFRVLQTFHLLFHFRTLLSKKNTLSRLADGGDVNVSVYFTLPLFHMFRGSWISRSVLSLFLTMVLWFLCHGQASSLARESILSFTSQKASGWFKEQVRILGGLDHVIDTSTLLFLLLVVLVFDAVVVGLLKLTLTIKSSFRGQP